MKILTIILALIVTTVVNSLVFMLCWNYVMPVVFGVKDLTFVQSLVFLTMLGVLAGDFKVSKK